MTSCTWKTIVGRRRKDSGEFQMRLSVIVVSLHLINQSEVRILMRRGEPIQPKWLLKVKVPSLICLHLQEEMKVVVSDNYNMIYSLKNDDNFPVMLQPLFSLQCDVSFKTMERKNFHEEKINVKKKVWFLKWMILFTCSPAAPKLSKISISATKIN